MAGSYAHLMDEGCGWSLIENMGDSYEATEELLWLVLYFARAATKGATDPHETVTAVLSEIYYPMRRGEIPKDDLMARVDHVMES